MTISITTIDTLNYEKSIRAIHQTITKLKPITEVNKIYWFSDKKCDDYINGVPVEHIAIPTITKIIDYQKIALKLLPITVKEDYDLIVQYDGYAYNTNAWTDEFFNYDYIGANWFDGGMGNGGFSLRSKKLYDKLNELDVKYLFSDFPINIVDRKWYFTYDLDGSKMLPEDTVICRIYRKQLEELGVRFAPTHIADQFSVECCQTNPPWLNGEENKWLGKSFGFHGKEALSSRYYK